MKTFRRFLSLFLVVAMSVCLMANTLVSTYSDSNDRISTFLKMAAGAEITDEDVSGLTIDQLQFLGVYLSNFYQPFGTEFGGDNDEIAENCKTDMVEALQTKLAFSDEMATSLVEYVLQMTRDSIQYLDLYYKDDEGNYVKIDSCELNYYNFIRLMLGRSEDVFSGWRKLALTNLYTPYANDYLEDGYKKTDFELFSGLMSMEEVNGTAVKSEYGFVNGGTDESSVVSFKEGGTWLSLLSLLANATDSDLGVGYWSENKSSVSYMSSSEMSSFGLNPNDYMSDSDNFLRYLSIYLALGGFAESYNPIGRDGKANNFTSAWSYDNSFTISYGVHKYKGGDNSQHWDRYWAVSEMGNGKRVSVNKFNSNEQGYRVIAESIVKIHDMDLWSEAVSIVNAMESQYLYCGYEKNGEVKAVFDCTTSKYLGNGYDYTASQLEFMKCLETVDISMGYGSNILDFNSADAGDDKEWDEALLTALCNRLADTDSISANKEMSLKSTMWGQKIAVDCFGNLLSMGANHQYVVVPACMNPYSWQAVDSNGEDVLQPGAFVNIVNAKNLMQVDRGALIGVNSSGAYLHQESGSSVSFDSSEVKHYTAKFDNFINSADGYKGIGSILSNSSVVVTNSQGEKAIAARLVRGQGDYIVQKNSFLPWSSTDVAKGAINNVINTYIELYPRDYSYSADVTNGSWYWGSDEYVTLLGNIGSIIDSNSGWLANNANVNVLDGFVFIDNLGIYRNEDGSSQDYNAFVVEHYLSEDGESGSSIAGGVSSVSPFGNHTSDIISGKLNNLSGCSEQALCSIYISYVYAYFYSDENKSDTIGKIGYRYAKENFPEPSNASLNIDLSLGQADYELEAIRDWTYYLLHPTQGYQYVTTLITNKLNQLLLCWHSDMVGTNGVGINTGTTKYRSTVGYVTMPDLSEIEWTDKLISFYQDCLPFLIIVVIVLMLLAFITGVLSLQRAIFAAVLFSVFLMIPTTLINGAVQQSNNISQRIYGEKFTYWAMIQQESYATQIDEAANSVGSSGDSTYSNYLRTLYGLNQEVYSNQGMESILLKWQAPKKMASLVLSSEDAKSLDGLSDVGKSMLYGMLGKSYGGQSYVDDEDAVYMYRSYLDISNFSRYIYQGIDSSIVQSTKDINAIKSILNGSFSEDLVSSVGDMSSVYEEYRNSGYTSWGLGESSANPNYVYITVPMSSNIMADAIRKSSGLSSWDSKDDLVAINQDIFNFGIPQFTNDTVGFTLDYFASTGNISKGSDRYTDLENYMRSYSSNENDFVGLAAYSLYSENVFYYYSWKLYHDGLGSESSLYDLGGYKNLLLGQEDGGYFYMVDGNGGLKDFMDMKSLFTYIIPYMKECNDLVREWDDVYGIFLYEGVPAEEGHWDDVAGDAELTAKYWHNLNVSRLYCLYCPWVDVMYDCSYADAETITVMGERVVIEDPLNPASYPDSRPMIFSEAEMKDYGLSEADLTEVERLILKCNEDFQERMYELLNYYNFSDITLNTAAAMQCAFSFNTIFSETGIMSDNHNIYPQSYDLANFSYDAFLRFILAESTGESLLDSSKTSGTSAGNTTGDFYERVVNNSSTTTAILLIVLDVIAVYVLPAFKMFFLVAAFISSILIVFVSLVKIEDNAKFIHKVASGFLMPLIKFFAVTVGLSLVVSLFMGTGNNSITQTDELSISMGDPTIVILVMIALNIFVIILYWKIIKGLLKDIKFNGKLFAGFAGGVLGAAGGFVAGAFTGALGAARAGANGAVSAHRYRSLKNAVKGGNKNDVPDQEPPQAGTGVESSRASQRGSTPVEDKQDNSSPNRRDPLKTQKSHKSGNEESEDKKRQKLDDAATSGAEKIKQGSDEARNKRFSQYRKDAERDFGYAKNSDGGIDTSKLTAKDRYKYESRVRRTAQRETEIEFGSSSRDTNKGNKPSQRSKPAQSGTPAKGKKPTNKGSSNTPKPGK